MRVSRELLQPGKVMVLRSTRPDAPASLFPLDSTMKMAKKQVSRIPAERYVFVGPRSVATNWQINGDHWRVVVEAG